MIHTEKLRKVFSNKEERTVEAVKGISLDVQQGEIFGLLGPNGAGKTTTMRMLCTLLTPTSGLASVVGFDLHTQSKEIRKRIGYVSQKGGMEIVATGRENIMLQAQLYGMSKTEAAQRVTEVIDRLRLSNFADRKVITYSGGQRRIFDLASGIIHTPELLFLDEPSTGLDPQSRARVWEEVVGLHKAGTTIFLTTHYLEEADALCHRVAIVDQGDIVALGSPAELKRQIAGDIIVMGFDAENKIEEIRNLINKYERVKETQIADTSLHVFVDKGDQALPVIIQLLNQRGITPTTIQLSRPSLDDVFLKLTGRSLRESEASAKKDR
ncbi:MAG: ATP-binding cassette domain-containing protein [Patescibacteria group bacterium]|nr:ATP-binding cassette domain-containing protein [Patescibacteria group bacterium]MCL5224446.1 ATP-binding cassette domain-containing protein [Patescibacteria group bacterium]